MTDPECVEFLQWALPRLDMRWHGFRKVRRQVCRRIERRLRELGLPGIATYRAYFQANPAEWAELDSLCHVTISRFYRDREVFRFLGRTVLPALARTAREAGRRLEAWSAGCASGEEAYTLGLVWQRAVANDFPDVAFHVLATDVDETILGRARVAEYPQSSVRDLPAAWRRDAFVLTDGVYRLCPEVRSLVNLRHHDLRQRPPGGPFDLVLCRNVAFTYFDEDLQRTVARRLAGCMRPGGALVTGMHEVLPDSLGFSQWSLRLRIYRRGRVAAARRPFPKRSFPQGRSAPFPMNDRRERSNMSRAMPDLVREASARPPSQTSGASPPLGVRRLDETLLGEARRRREYRCRRCGYGAVASGPPPRCPMCGASAWLQAGSSSPR